MKKEFSIIPLTVEARGEIIHNNLPEFRELVRAALGNINRDLITDEDFGQAELDVKALKAAEDAVRDAAVQAFDDRLKQMLAELNETADEIRAPRLEIEKLIAKRKDEVKAEIIEEALTTFDIEPPLARRCYLVGLQTEIKGKRTLDSMRKACRIYATTQQGLIAECRTLLDSFEKAHGADLISDRRTLELEKPEGLEAELRRRFEAKRAADERKRLEEEAAKAKAELAAAQSAKMNPHNLPPPPKIGSIQVGNAAPENVATVTPAPLELSNEISEAEEMRQFFATVKAAFAHIREHKMRLIHEGNMDDATRLGEAVNGWHGTIKGKMEARP